MLVSDLQNIQTFEKRMIGLMCQFVDVISRFQSLEEDSKNQYSLIAKRMQEIVQGIIQIIESFPLLSDLICDLTFDKFDQAKFAKFGLFFEDCTFPAPARFCLDHIVERVQAQVGAIVDFTKLEPCARNVLTAKLLSCVKSVKLLRVFTKDTIARHGDTSSHQQSAPIARSNETQIMSSAMTLTEKISGPKEPHKGIYFENSKVKGGELEKLVEFLICEGSSSDSEFLPAFIATLHSFSTTPELLDIIMNQYEMLEMFAESQLMQVRLK